MPRRRYLHRRSLCCPLRVVLRRPSDLVRNLRRGRCHDVTFNAALPFKKVGKVGMMLSLLFLMNQSLMARITLVVLVSTQQAELAPVGAAALLS